MRGMTIHIDTVQIQTLTMTGPAAPALVWHVGPINPKGESTMPIEVSMSTEEQCRLAIAPADARRGPGLHRGRGTVDGGGNLYAAPH